MGELKYISVRNLIVWTDNPRMANEQILTESEAIKILIDEVGIAKMKVLAKDVFSYGLNPHRQIIAVSNGDETYNVYDGNRRISVIKSVLSKDTRFAGIENKIELTLDTEIHVYTTDMEEALRLIEVEHTGEAEGLGQIRWEAFQRDYAFRHNNKEAAYPYAYEVSRICGLNRKSHFKKIPYTDLDTIFSDERVKKLFNIENEWDFTNTDFIKEVYQKLCEAKTSVPYSRFLPRLTNEKELSEFEKRLFPNTRNETAPQHPQHTPLSTDNHNSAPEQDSPMDMPLKVAPTPADMQNAEIKAYAPIPETEARRNNSYRINPTILFQWRGKGININHAVFKPTLNFAIALQIHTDSDMRRIAPYLYRVLLEMALRHWCNWYRSNESSFNTGNLSDYTKTKDCLLGTTAAEVSFVSEKKITNIIDVLEVVKNSSKNSMIRECFKGKSVQAYADMIRELNEVIHGSKEHIDKSTLIKYDEMILNYLVALSISLND